LIIQNTIISNGAVENPAAIFFQSSSNGGALVIENVSIHNIQSFSTMIQGNTMQISNLVMENCDAGTGSNYFPFFYHILHKLIFF
jgi:hypothetical protein